MEKQQILNPGKRMSNRRSKLKMAFEELEREMELLTPIELEMHRGGFSGVFDDCVIEAVAFATGQSYNDVLDQFGVWASTQSGWDSNPAMNELTAVQSGMNADVAGQFSQYMGLSSQGDVPTGPEGYSVSGDQSVVFLDYGGGSGHAVVLTGNASSGEYYYYDPQNGTTGTIAKDDSSIITTYGYY